MKKIALALLIAGPLAASAAQYVTVEDCNRGESGTLCEKVTYKIRPGSTPIVEVCTVPSGEAGYVPCPENAKVPGWLEALNKWFEDNGFSAPVDRDGP